MLAEIEAAEFQYQNGSIKSSGDQVSGVWVHKGFNTRMVRLKALATFESACQSYHVSIPEWFD